MWVRQPNQQCGQATRLELPVTVDEIRNETGVHLASAGRAFVLATRTALYVSLFDAGTGLLSPFTVMDLDLPVPRRLSFVTFLEPCCAEDSLSPLLIAAPGINAVWSMDLEEDARYPKKKFMTVSCDMRCMATSDSRHVAVCDGDARISVFAPRISSPYGAHIHFDGFYVLEMTWTHAGTLVIMMSDLNDWFSKHVCVVRVDVTDGTLHKSNFGLGNCFVYRFLALVEVDGGQVCVVSSEDDDCVEAMYDPRGVLCINTTDDAVFAAVLVRSMRATVCVKEAHTFDAIGDWPTVPVDVHVSRDVMAARVWCMSHYRVAWMVTVFRATLGAGSSCRRSCRHRRQRQEHA